jgi:hypothetical protein
MAKLTIEEAKPKLEKIAKTIEALKGMGLEVDSVLTDEFERLTKIITGNASANVANTFNEKIAAQINGNADFVEFLAGQIGTRARLTVTVVTDEAGKKSIKFEAGSSGASGGQKSGTHSGGTKASTPYNNWKVTVLDTPATAGYATKEGTFNTAAKAVEFILNGGKNPMNLGADWQSGNSMVRALVGQDGKSGLLKNEEFTKNFTLEASYVEPVKKEAEQAADSTTAQA